MLLPPTHHSIISYYHLCDNPPDHPYDPLHYLIPRYHMYPYRPYDPTSTCNYLFISYYQYHLPIYYSIFTTYYQLHPNTPPYYPIAMFNHIYTITPQALPTNYRNYPITTHKLPYNYPNYPITTL